MDKGKRITKYHCPHCRKWKRFNIRHYKVTSIIYKVSLKGKVRIGQSTKPVCGRCVHKV